MSSQKLPSTFHQCSQQGHLALPPVSPCTARKARPGFIHITALLMAALWLIPGGEAELFVLALRLLQAQAWPTRHLPSLPTLGTQPSVHSLSTRPLALKGAALSSSLPVRTIFPAAFHLASSLSFTAQLECHLSERLPSPSCPNNLFSCSLLAHTSAARSTIRISWFFACLFTCLPPNPMYAPRGTGSLHVLFSAMSIVPRQCLTSRCLINVYMYMCICI